MQTFRDAAVYGLDSRLRGNDQRLERDAIPNDTTTHVSAELHPQSRDGIIMEGLTIHANERILGV